MAPHDCMGQLRNERNAVDELVLPFTKIGLDNLALVGGKNASLGELCQRLRGEEVSVPPGFAITARAFRQVLDGANAWPALRHTLEGLDPADITDLARRGERARQIVYDCALPADLIEEITSAYRALCPPSDEAFGVAVRSSATAEDLPEASFAGQHESFLNVRGLERLLDAVRRCFASLYTDRAIRYRIDHGFDHFQVLLSVGVQRMVRSDLASSGVIFTLDPESGFRDVVLVTGTYGLGETLVQGAVDPDEFYLFKPTFLNGYRAVLRRLKGSKANKMIYATTGDRTTVTVETTNDERSRYCLADPEIIALGAAALAIERHYSAQAGAARPMDIEWAKDGLDGRLYITQARPETVAARRAVDRVERYELRGKGSWLVSGRAVGERVASGKARTIRTNEDLAQLQSGEILIAETTSPDWGMVMKRAAAIVTNRGGRTCHAAIVARELGIPAVVGAVDATTKIETGSEITVSCAEGAVGNVYAGKLPFEIKTINVAQMPQPRTRVMVNLGNPDAAFRARFLPNEGVGLARMEFIISDYIKAHPMALAHPERVADATVRAAISALTEGYESPSAFFVERLSEGVATIAAAFHPKPVILRMSDFKTNEYASLLGGEGFEPHEDNPMIGFRGASRYAHPSYADGFALECAAVRRVREELGLTNLKLMIPFCRRIEEARAVIEEMAKHGLVRGDNGLEIYVMCEIPNNVVLIDRFAEYFDGFSIGSNDLTQLVLGVDRDSEIVAFDFDERDEGVKTMIRMAIEGAHRNGRHVGICGEAPADYPEIAQFLVELGIDSISVNPDAVIRTLQLVDQVERVTH